jgi:hypothetical protein
MQAINNEYDPTVLSSHRRLDTLLFSYTSCQCLRIRSIIYSLLCAYQITQRGDNGFVQNNDDVISSTRTVASASGEVLCLCE